MRLPTRFSVVLVLAVCLVSCAPVAPGVAQGQTPTPEKTLADLWIDVSMGPPLVEWFDEIARPGDIARADHVALIDLLDEITAGQRLVVFKSAADAAEAMPFIADRVDILGYNLESGPANPANEQADPIAAAQAMRDLAEQYGVKLAIGPDRTFAQNYGPALAPYVDLFVLQVQRVQTEPETVRSFVVPLAEELRRANPDIQISVQVRTEGDVEQIADLLESLLGSIDGVSILTSAETTDIAKELVAELRSRDRPLLPPNQAPSRPPSGEGVPRVQAAELATPVATATRPVQPSPSPKPAATAVPALANQVEPAGAATAVPEAGASAPAIVPGALQRFLVPLAGLLLVAAIGGGVIGALIVLLARPKQ